MVENLNITYISFIATDVSAFELVARIGLAVTIAVRVDVILATSVPKR